jgi:hypothetical protein
MNFHDRQTVKLGTLGEQIADQYLIRRGFIPYAPVCEGAHPFDRLCAFKKRKILIAETKTKPARRCYPDTGINKKHFDDYLHIEETHKLSVWLFFVDSDSGTVYGNKLAVLREPFVVFHNGRELSYPLEVAGTIYFPLAKMKTIATLTDEQKNQLRGLSGRAKTYENFEGMLA